MSKDLQRKPKWERRQLWRGFKTGLPVCVGILPVGLSFGLLAMEAGLEVWQAVLMSMLVVAGASQILAVGMLMQAAAAPTIVLATFLLNLRHLVMSSSVMARLRELPLLRRLLLSYVICDESFAIFSLSPEQPAEDSFLLGVQCSLFSVWTLSTLAGALANAVLPAIVAKSFGVAIYAVFLALLAPKVRESKGVLLVVLITMAINTLLCQLISPGVAVVLSMLLGAGIGLLIIKDEPTAAETPPPRPPAGEEGELCP